jgi:hypothetical protein
MIRFTRLLLSAQRRVLPTACHVVSDVSAVELNTNKKINYMRALFFFSSS